MKNKRIKILLLLSVFVLFCLCFNSVNAAITIDKQGGVGTNQGVFAAIGSTLIRVLEYIGGMAASGVFATTSQFIALVSVGMFLALEAIFAVATTDISHLALPDNIVFNRFAVFDPNFINPANGSLIKGFGTILNDLFASFQTIAISLFIIAAMITGIKMALSTVASKKAQYKEAALKWLTGFLILLCLKWLLAGIFYINEVLVSRMFKISCSDELSVPIYITEAIPIFGKLLTDLIKGLESLTGWEHVLNVDGYLGIILANLCKSVGGNIIASVIAFIIMGQTFTVAGSYLKRLFMCMLLGVISPLIVAADTIITITGKQSTIFKNWLKNFTTTVFMQTIHAAYMMVVLQILSNLYSNGTFSGGLTETQVSIVTIVLTTGLVKLEKLIKGMFGIGDSFAGDLKDGAKGMVKAMGAVKGLSEGFKAVSDNKKKEADAGKRKMAYMNELDKVKKEGDGKKSTTVNVTNNNSDNSTSNSTSNDTHNPIANSETNNSSGFNGGENNNSQHSSGDYLQDVLNRQSQPLTREQKIHKLEEAIAEEEANENSAKFARIMAPANIAAGIGLGLGMGEDVGESLFKGGYITKGLDYASEKVGYKAAGGKRKSFYESEKRDGEKYGYEPSEKIVKEKTTIEKTVSNSQLCVNPVAVGKEWKKQFSELGDVFGDTMKKKMKEIDKDLDNQ